MYKRDSQLNFIINRLIEMLSLQLIKVRGKSMEPSIAENSWVVSFRAGFRRQPPRRFDVIRLEEPGTYGHWIVKRIVGMPGEEVAVRGGDLFVNGEMVDDPFAYCPDADSGIHEWWPRDDEYVVLGDNRSASTDSRKFGAIKRSSIRARIRTSRPN